MGCCSNEKGCGCETKRVTQRKVSLIGVVAVVFVVLVIINWQ